MPRARDLGIGIGTLPTGPTNSVLDVDGRRARARDGHPRHRVHRVTSLVLAEDAYLRPLVAGGGAVLNGLGDCTGFLTTIRESGMLETPVWLTSTMQLGRVYDAACEIELARHPEVADDVCIPVVGECDDSFLNDCRRMWVTADDVRAAHAAALASRGSATPPDEGCGRRRAPGCPAWASRAASAPSSRVTPGGHTVAVLLMTNFGERARLTVDGVPVGRLLPAEPVPGPAHGPPARASASSSPTRRSTRRLRAAGPADRAGPGPHRLDGPPRQRRDLPGREHHRPHRPRRHASTTGPRLAGRRSTTCSRRWSTPPRSRCSTRC